MRLSHSELQWMTLTVWSGLNNPRNQLHKQRWFVQTQQTLPWNNTVFKQFNVLNSVNPLTPTVAVWVQL